MNKLALIVCSLLFFVVSVKAQKRTITSQYMHNRYAINPAFAGNREALSIFGGFRKKWVGINGSPNSQYFTGHTPLKNDKVALGVDLFNHQYGVSGSSGGTFSYTYRLKMADQKVLAFGLSAGVDLRSSNWANVRTLETGVVDPEFAENESHMMPLVGFGAAWYNNRFFAGLSIPSFFYYDEFNGGSSSFDLNKADYLLTGGYLFNMAEKWYLQPSALLRINPDDQIIFEANATAIYDETIWFGASYRTTKDAVLLVGYQITPQLRFSYSFDYSMTEISTYNNGTHEIALQFDFGYKIKTANPKFF